MVPESADKASDPVERTVPTSFITRFSSLISHYSSLITHHASLLPRLRSAIWTTVALVFLLACDLFLFRNALVEGQIYYRSDTVTYYFPILDRLTDVLREGRLLLWTRHLFGGFPLFADGEAGMLYPPNVLAYLLLSEQEAFIWLRVLRYFMAATFTYAFLRTLRLHRFGAIIGALTFAFGSFMITQMHHTNVVNTALWLPLTLCLIEMALRNVRRRRWLYATAAGISVGVQALALHIQPLLMSGAFLAAYLPFRVMLCPLAWPPVPGKPSPTSSDRFVAQSAAKHLLERITAVCGALRRAVRSILPPRPVTRPPGEGSQDTSLPEVSGRRSLGLVLRWPASRGLPPIAATRFLRKRVPWRLGIDNLLSVSRWTGGWAGRIGTTLFHRLVLTGLMLAVIPVTAFGIAAAQLIPLAELGTFSFRGPGVTYQFATSFSMPVHNLVNLIFPYFFRHTNRLYWSLWSEWETTLYVGIAPLVLASIALLFVRSRMVLFFAAVATLSVLLAFGNYSPYPLYEQLYHLPGFSSLRVPGRFGMLITFTIAVLAAYGADWLCRTLRPRGESPRPGWWSRFSQSVGINGFVLYLLVLLTAMAGLVWWMASLRIWIEKEPWSAKLFLAQNYLSLRNDRPWLTPDAALSYLNYSLDLTNAKTTTSLALMLATFLLLFCWFAFRRFWRGWALLLSILVAADMLTFATDFHPTVRVDQLSNPNPAAQWLMTQNRDGMDRVYTSREVRKTEPNKLLPFQVSDIGGYSSLETIRHQDYMSELRDYEKLLLDLYSVRFVVQPKRPTALPSFEYTGYNPNRPLAEGPRANPSSNVTFYMDPPVNADEVSLISSLRSATDIPQNAEVAEIVVVDTQGEQVTLQVRAGRDTAEWAFDRPDVTPHMGHQRPRVADQIWVWDPDGPRYKANLYYSNLKLDKRRTVARVTFRYTHPKGAVRLFGMMLWETPFTAHQVLARHKFIPRYEDDEVQIVENPSRLPRAYLVPTAKAVKRSEIMETMAHGAFDPEKQVLLEIPDKPRLLPDTGTANPEIVEEWLRGNPEVSPGTVEIVDYQSDSVVIRTDSRRNALLFLADSYYPGWKATVDGRQERVYRADYLFRAVPVPSGQHEVRFYFEPESFALGMDTSIFSVIGLLLLWTLLLFWVPLRKGGRFVWKRVRPRRFPPPIVEMSQSQ